MAKISEREDKDVDLYRQKAADALKNAAKWQHKCENQAKEMESIQYEADKAKAQITTLQDELHTTKMISY